MSYYILIFNCLVCCWKTVRKIYQCLWSDVMVDCKLSDCQYVLIANVGY